MIDITIRVLNEGMRPPLTKWQAKFRKWYEQALVDNQGSPQEIQELFPEFDVMCADLKRANKIIISFVEQLHAIAFDGKK